MKFWCAEQAGITQSSFNSWAPAKIPKVALILIVAASLLKGIVWSLVVPPLYGFDEPQHLIYGRYILKTHNLRIKPTTLIPLDIWELDEPPDKRTRFETETRAREQYYDDVDRVVVKQPSFYTYHPPLYYCLVAAVSYCTQHVQTVWEVLASRAISVALGICTAIMAFFAGRIFYKGDDCLAPMAMAMLVIYQPMSAFTFATITNCAMEITLVSLLIVTGLAIIQTKPGKSSLVLSVIMVAGILNKLSFTALVPSVAGLALWDWKNKRKISPQSGKKVPGNGLLTQLIIVLLPSALASFWWFQQGWTTGGDSLVHSFQMAPHPKPFNIIEYFIDKPWFETYGKITASYFGHFGWHNAALPIPLLAVLAVFVGSCAVLSLKHAVTDLRNRTPSEAPHRAYSILLITGINLSLLLFYTAIDMRVHAVLGGDWFVVRGQYYLSALLGQALWVVSAIQWKNATAWSNVILCIVCAAAVALNFYALIAVVGAFCYGTTNLFEILGRAAELQPVSSTILGSLFLAYAVVSGLFVAFTSTLCRTTRT